MDRLRQLRQPLIAAGIFLWTGLNIASMFLMTLREMGLFMNGYPGAGVLALTSPLVFLCACGMVFFRPSFGYALGGIAALLALPWFVLIESSSLESTWHYLNGPDQFFEGHRPVALLRILSVALLATALTSSILRLLLPSVLRTRRLSGYTWPAIAVGIAVPFAWLCHSAMPWMLPGIVDRGGSSDVRILHVEKRGLGFHETSVGVSIRDGRFGVRQYDRRLFQYGFHGLDISGVMPEATCHRADDLVRSPTLRNLRTAPAIALRSWNAEGWYIATVHSPLQAFTSEYGTSPPTAVRDLLEQIAKLPGEGQSFAIEDVCMGFCYDPGAGLGFLYSNERCMTLPDGTTRCL